MSLKKEPRGSPQVVVKSDTKSQVSRPKGSPQVTKSDTKPQVSKPKGSPQVAKSDTKPQVSRPRGSPQVVVKSDTKSQVSRMEPALCNRCNKEHPLKKDGCFCPHLSVDFEKGSLCKRSSKPPLKIYAETGKDEKWGSCKCSETLYALTGKGNAVEEHFWVLQCPGSGKKPADVQAVPGPDNLELQPEPLEEPEDVAKQREAWRTQYSERMQKALEAPEEFDPLVRPTDASGLNHVTCLVDSRWKVTDFKSFIQGVFFIGVRRGNRMLKDKISKESAELSEKLLERCKKISQENRQYKEVSLEEKPDMLAWHMKAYMLEAYGEQNLSRIANENPQLVNDRKYGLAKPADATKEQYGLQLLYQIWQNEYRRKGMREDRVDDVGALAGELGNLDPKLEPKPSPK